MKKLLYELLYANPKPLELLLAIQSIFYGGWLLLPPDTFSVGRTFDVMSKIAPENVWGICIFTVGIIQFMGTFTNRIVARRVLASLDLVTWMTIDICLWMSGVPSLAPIITFTSVIASALILVELFYQARPGRYHD